MGNVVYMSSWFTILFVVAAVLLVAGHICGKFPKQMNALSIWFIDEGHGKQVGLVFWYIASYAAFAGMVWLVLSALNILWIYIVVAIIAFICVAGPSCSDGDDYWFDNAMQTLGVITMITTLFFIGDDCFWKLFLSCLGLELVLLSGILRRKD